MNEFHLAPTISADNWTASNFKNLSVIMWLGNNNAQSRYLFGSSNIRDDMSWTLEESIEADGREFAMSVSPYFKLSHIMGRYSGEIWPTYPEDIRTDRKAIKAKFVDPLLGRWKRDDWSDMKDTLSKNGLPASGIDEIKASGRNFIDLSVGYNIVIDIPLSVLIELDRNNSGFISPANDKIASLVYTIPISRKTFRMDFRLFLWLLVSILIEALSA